MDETSGGGGGGGGGGWPLFTGNDDILSHVIDFLDDVKTIPTEGIIPNVGLFSGDLTLPCFTDPFLQDQLYVQPSEIMPSPTAGKRKRANSHESPLASKKPIKDLTSIDVADLWNPLNERDILQRTFSPSSTPSKPISVTEGVSPKVPIAPIRGIHYKPVPKASLPFFLGMKNSTTSSPASSPFISSPSDANSFSEDDEDTKKRVPRVALPPRSQISGRGRRKSSRLNQRVEIEEEQIVTNNEPATLEKEKIEKAELEKKTGEKEAKEAPVIKCLPLFDLKANQNQGGQPSHLASEQRRRALMKDCYDQLHLILPTTEYRKPSKANLLQAAVRHLQRLELTLQRVVRETHVMRMNNVEMIRKLIEAGIELPDIPGYPIPPALVEQIKVEVIAGKTEREQQKEQPKKPEEKTVPDKEQMKKEIPACLIQGNVQKKRAASVKS